jgi:hypothetical protein
MLYFTNKLNLIYEWMQTSGIASVGIASINNTIVPYLIKKWFSFETSLALSQGIDNNNNNNNNSRYSFST